MHTPPDKSDCSSKIPIVVDLDKTLLRTDSLVESLISSFTKQPIDTLTCLIKHARNPAHLKKVMAPRLHWDPALLPYNASLLTWLSREKSKGRTIILATAADASLAQPIASHLGLFDHVIASDGNHNIKGEAKANAIKTHLGNRGFLYIGDSNADFAVWRHADEAGVVNASARMTKKLHALQKPTHHFDSPVNRPRHILRAMRPQQWAKNFLVFIPMIAGHEWANGYAIIGALLAFLAMSLIASSVYLINDLLDMQDDRAHAAKKRRPIAAGEVQPGTALVTALLMAIVGLTIGFLWGWGLFLSLLIYIAATTAYSLVIKTIPVTDIIWLSGLYTIRLLVGAQACDIVPSYWLLTFSTFVFFSLACIKRSSELLSRFQKSDATFSRRGYQAEDIQIMMTFGIASAFSSVIVLLLYLHDEAVTQLYSYPDLLMIVGILLLYWLCRAWLLTRRGQMTHDPVVFALRDRISLLVAAMISVVFLISVGI